ncbi:MAG: hypothetical protein GWO20_09620, partial [Candidatus Korarchaeota archaeon]|nr:hypothetical protein [Candidatus Korarchaeota archaeon]NIU83714.1 hypothetical protein [Candidatus Thorarchaeota archaeon]NIW13917.1 hypothetical protein [Candidatus Thorarchaeota archaeon]NIW52032.1 hypothetical protein [Candidatus Korarchaeota archaeon]
TRQLFEEDFIVHPYHLSRYEPREEEKVPYEGFKDDLAWLEERDAVSRGKSKVKTIDLAERIKVEHKVSEWKAKDMRRKLVKHGYIKQERKGSYGYMV